MALSIIEAAKLLERGEAGEYISRFIGSVKTAVFSKYPIAINLDDALVASLALARLVDSAEGRKILKTPKRKNIQYKAEDFGFQSPQRAIAREVIDGKISYNEALDKLATTFAEGIDRERTGKRLLDDLISSEERNNEFSARALVVAGWDGTEATKEEAVRRFLSAFTNDVPGIAK